MELVEGCLQIVYFVLGGHLLAVGNFFQAVEHLFLRLIDLTVFWSLLAFLNFLNFGNFRNLGHFRSFFCWRNSFVVYYFRSLGCLTYFFFTNPRFEDVFLRVHN